MKNKNIEFETLPSNKKRIYFLCGFVCVVVLLVTILIGFSKAKYRVTQSIPIIHGTINYKVPDLNLVSLYLQNEEGDYIEADTIPSGGYTLNEAQSYCGQSNNGEIVKDESINIIYENGAINVNNLTKKGTKCYLYFDEGSESMVAKDAILTYAKRGDETPDFSKTSCSVGSNNGGNCEEETVGLYEGSESGEVIYYFRGDVDDNWVSFAGYYWRIIRTNSNGSIRMIYNGTSTATTGTGTQISLNGSTNAYAFNSSRDRSEYVGLKYTTGEQHGNTTDSSIMGTLNSWYSSNLTSYESYIDRNAGFCGDRNMASGYSWSSSPSSEIYYAAYGRLNTNKIPSLECSRSDLFTVTGASKGNASLTNPIGLITADEVAMAGGVYDTANQSYYLYTAQAYWTMSPYDVNSNSNADVFRVFSDGRLTSGNSVIALNCVRPVINLRADVQLSGTGTSTDPYIVQN